MRRTSRPVAAAVVAAALVVLPGCGDDAKGLDERQVEAQSRAIDDFQADRRAAAEAAVRDGRLPPVALEMLEADGVLNRNFIDGPDNGEDVVRTEGGGTRGPKLAWDLDQDGRISSDEREITEAELFDAFPELTR